MVLLLLYMASAVVQYYIRFYVLVGMSFYDGLSARGLVRDYQTCYSSLNRL